MAERRARLASLNQRVEPEIEEEVETTSASDERAPHRESTIPYNPKVTGNILDFSGQYYAPGTRPKINMTTLVVIISSMVQVMMKLNLLNLLRQCLPILSVTSIEMRMVR